jgi:long-chain acyl-CoA synthetase
MTNNEILTIPSLISESFRKHGNNQAMGFVGEDAITYNQLRERTRSVMRLLEDLRIEQGDKVAILSTGMANWGVAYLAITSI